MNFKLIVISMNLFKKRNKLYLISQTNHNRCQNNTNLEYCTDISRSFQNKLTKSNFREE
jgi:hypothetical protein